MTRERLDNWCEKGILALVLAVLVFGPLATGAVRALEFLIVQGLTMGAVLLWILRLSLNPGLRLLWPSICWPVLGFVIYAIIRYHQADIEYVARQELIRILVYACLFFVIQNNLTRQDTTQLVSCLLIFLGMAIAMYAIYQFATHSEYVWHFIRPEPYRNRGSGTYICPNHLAGFLEMLLPVGLAYTLTGRLPHLLRVFLGYSCLVLLAGVGVSVSRGGWLATVAALLLFFILLIQKRQYRIPALIVLLLLVGAVAFAYSKAEPARKRLENTFVLDSQDTIRIRVWLWRSTFRMWRDHFWLGVGPGHFDYRFPNYRSEEFQSRPGYAHNDYLNTMAEWGVVGTGLILTTLLLLYASAFKILKYVRRERSELTTKPSNRRAFVFGASIGLVAILIHSLTDFNMHVPANAILAVALMALLSGNLRFVSERYWVNLSLWGRIGLATFGSGTLLYLGAQAWRQAREYVWLDRAEQERFFLHARTVESKKKPETGPAASGLAGDTTDATRRYLAALRHAAVLEPTNFETTYELGDSLRRLSWQGLKGYEQLAEEAINCFQRGARLNRYDPNCQLGIGLCLDWLGRHDEAAPYFEAALKLDPNDYYVRAYQGWHFFQTRNYAAAKQWFERARKLQMAWHQPIASQYLSLLDAKLKEAPATGPNGQRR
jgi:O-antigen ligase